MKKLTAEKCRSHIARLKRYEGESLYQFPFEIEMLEAFEIALPILEQQERGERQERGEWIEWKGGLVAPVTGRVDVRYRNGKEEVGHKAGDFSWKKGLGGVTIIAYRIIPERATNQNGEQ